MPTTAIIGAGISGLTSALRLAEQGPVTIYEAAPRPGGLLRCERLPEGLFHTCGGHVFNTRRSDVEQWFWPHFERDREWTDGTRHATIHLEAAQRFVDYPIESHIYQLPLALQERVLAELLDGPGPQGLTASSLREFLTERFGPTLYRLSVDYPMEPPLALQERVLAELLDGPGPRGSTAASLREFLTERFGATLYRLYFAPYNAKVWGRPADKIPMSWLEGKLPTPTRQQLLLDNINHADERRSVHSTFRYPRSGGSSFTIERLSAGLDVRCGRRIEHLERTNDKWLVDGEPYDRVIYTGHVRRLPSLLPAHTLDGLAKSLEELESHGTTTAFALIDQVPYSWIYLPSDRYDAHRIIVTGNFSPLNNAPAAAGRLTASIEWTGHVKEQTVREQLPLLPLHPRLIKLHHTEASYPIQTADTRRLIALTKERLAPLNMHIVGRWGEWEYHNMDAAIGSALDLTDKLLNQ